MDPVAATPTDPRDYATLSMGYAAVAGAVALLASHYREDPAPTQPAELALYGVATAGLARLLGKEKITEWVRQPFVETPPDGEQHPRGTGKRYVVGELLTCTRCLGSWSALGLVTLRALAPRPAGVGATLLALSYVNNVLQAFLTEELEDANAASAQAAAAAHAAEVRRAEKDAALAG